MKTVNAVAKSYAKALYQSLQDKGKQAKAIEEVRALAGVVNSMADAKDFFSHPLVAPEHKKTAMESVLKKVTVSDEVKATLLTMAERNRLSSLPDLQIALQELVDKDQGVTRGIVKSSRALSPEMIAETENKISKIIQKKVVLSFEEDSRVIAGVVAEVGGWTFDDSIETHLSKINEKLAQI